MAADLAQDRFKDAIGLTLSLLALMIDIGKLIHAGHDGFSGATTPWPAGLAQALPLEDYFPLNFDRQFTMWGFFGTFLAAHTVHINFHGRRNVLATFAASEAALFALNLFVAKTDPTDWAGFAAALATAWVGAALVVMVSRAREAAGPARE